MSKALRLSEKWFRRGLWLVALVFASFLIGLGGTIVGDLPQVERALQLDDFLDMAQVAPLRAQARVAREAQETARNALEQAELQVTVLEAGPRISGRNWAVRPGDTVPGTAGPLTPCRS